MHKVDDVDADASAQVATWLEIVLVTNSSMADYAAIQKPGFDLPWRLWFPVMPNDANNAYNDH